MAYLSTSNARATGLLLLSLLTSAAYAQQSVGIGTTSPDSKAALDVQAAGKGLLIPRMDSAARAAISSPPNGLMVFQTDGRAGFWYYFGGAWLFLPDKARSGDNLGNHTATQNLKLGANTLSNNGTGGLQFNTAGMAGFNTPAATNTPLTALAPGGSTSARVYVAQNANLTQGADFSAISDNNLRVSLGVNNSGHPQAGAAYVWYYGNGPLRIATNSAERLRVTATGRVGIGTTAPTRTLHVAGSMRVDTLSGTGTRLVTASATGDLGTQASDATNGLFWGLTGNAGTTPATQFVGTTDAQDLVLRTNNTERLRLTQSGALYQTIANNNTFLGLNAGGGINGTAGNNVYVGNGAGQTNATGADNVAVGLNAGSSSSTTSSAMVGTLAGTGSSGTSNTLIGGAAGYGAAANSMVALGYAAGIGAAGTANVVLGAFAGYPGGSLAGGENVIVGAQTVPSATGAQNTVVGTLSGATLANGNQNTFLGYRTGNDVSTASGNTFVGNLAGRFTSTGSNNTMLGNNADVSAGNGAITNATAIGANAHVTQSNSLVLGGTGANAVSVGIGVTAPSSTLQVNGSFAIKAVNNLAGSPAGTPLGTNGYLGLSPAGGADYYLLPAASSCPGRVYYLRNNSTGNIAYIGSSGGAIYEGGTTAAAVLPYFMQPTGLTKTVTVISDGTNWTLIKGGN